MVWLTQFKSREKLVQGTRKREKANCFSNLFKRILSIGKQMGNKLKEKNLHEMIAPEKSEFIKIILVCVVAFGTAILKTNYKFIFDDNIAVLKNADITNTTRPIPELINEVAAHDFWGQPISNQYSHKSYRPLITFLFAMEFRFFEFETIVSSMRRINFIIHIAVCLTMNVVFRRVLPECDKNVILSAVMLFAAHPIHTEAICSIVGRADILCGFIFLWAIYHYCGIMKEHSDYNEHIADRKWRGFVRMVFMVHIAVVCMLTKEIGITLLPFCACLDFITNFELPKLRKTDKTRRFNQLLATSQDLYVRIIILVAIMSAMVILRLVAMNYDFPDFNALENQVAKHPQFWTRFLSYPYVHAMHFWLLVCPDWLCCDWSYRSITLIQKLTDLRVVLGFLLYFFLIKCFNNGPRPLRFAIALIVIPFIPSTNIFPIGFVVAERVLYIPAMGYCLLVALGFHYVSKKWLNKEVCNMWFYFIMWTFLLRCIGRIADWDSEHALFRSGVRVNPNNAKIFYNLGTVYLEMGEYEKAYAYNKEANKIQPHLPHILNNLGNACRHLERHEEAITYYKEAIDIYPEYSMAYMNMGIAFANLNRANESIDAYLKANKFGPNNDKVFFNLGNLYHRMGNYSEAIKMYEKSIQLNEQNYRAHVNYLRLLAEYAPEGWLIAACNNAEFLAFNSIPVLSAIADVLGAKNLELNRVELLYLRLIRMDPKYIRGYTRLAILHKKRNDFNAANYYFKKAMKLDAEEAKKDEGFEGLRKYIERKKTREN